MSTPCNPDSVAPSGPFSHAVRIPAGYDTVVTAGQIGTIDTAGTLADTYEAQVDAAIANLGRVLAAAGATPQDIVKLTYYIVDYHPSIRPVHLNALQAFLGGNRPVTSLVGVEKLANRKLLFEIEAVAAVRPEAKPLAAKLA